MVAKRPHNERERSSPRIGAKRRNASIPYLGKCKIPEFDDLMFTYAFFSLFSKLVIAKDGNKSPIKGFGLVAINGLHFALKPLCSRIGDSGPRRLFRPLSKRYRFH